MREYLYVPLWNKYLKIISLALSSTEEKTIPLSQGEFTTLGNRKQSGYSFNLELLNGKVVNDISGSAVARDLHHVLLSDYVVKQKVKNRSVKINLGVDFKLHIRSVSTD